MSAPRIWALLPAAGRGTRMGAGENKVFLHVAGKSVLARTARLLASIPCITGVCVVATPGEQQRCRDEVQPVLSGKPLIVVPGADARQQSVYAGLKALADRADYVLVHDAARPLVDAASVIAVAEAAVEYGAALLGIPVRDTIKRVDALGRVVGTVPREDLWQAQTPQAFRLDLLIRAHDLAQLDGFLGTDDAQLMERMNHPVTMVKGRADNLKLTTPEDLHLASALLGGENGGEDMQHTNMPRMGMGYDVHRLVPERPLVLGGVTIPYTHGLLGHSDADVLTHAVMDALLGAAALGDIGMHFPDTQEQYRGADSIALLRAVIEKLRQAGFMPGNVDATVVAQRPKLAPFISQMREVLAQAMGISVQQVNIKATTTEGLGFNGEGQGMSAYAVAMVLPCPEKP